MMRHFGFIKTMLAAMTLACGAMAANARDQMIFDMESALVYCRETAMEGPEGIWEFAGDETQVLIKKETRGGKGYDIIVISTPDCRLSPGETIGNIQPSAKKGKYRMKLYVSRKMGTFSDSRTCIAEYIEKDDVILTHPVKLKISVRTMWFLPKFWRSLKISVDNPAASLPHGLVRIYPRKEPSKPVYL